MVFCEMFVDVESVIERPDTWTLFAGHPLCCNGVASVALRRIREVLISTAITSVDQATIPEVQELRQPAALRQLCL